MADRKSIPISGVWLRGRRGNIEVLVQVEGDWYVCISEGQSNPETISHIAEPRGIAHWPKEAVPKWSDEQ